MAGTFPGEEDGKLIFLQVKQRGGSGNLFISRSFPDPGRIFVFRAPATEEAFDTDAFSGEEKKAVGK